MHHRKYLRIQAEEGIEWITFGKNIIGNVKEGVLYITNQKIPIIPDYQICIPTEILISRLEYYLVQIVGKEYFNTTRPYLYRNGKVFTFKENQYTTIRKDRLNLERNIIADLQREEKTLSLFEKEMVISENSKLFQINLKEF